MKRLMFKVLFPAMRIGPNGITIADMTPSYVGPTRLMANNKLPPIVGGVHIEGGTKAGNKWVGCTYSKPPFVIPGYGEVVEV